MGKPFTWSVILNKRENGVSLESFIRPGFWQLKGDLVEMS